MRGPVRSLLIALLGLSIGIPVGCGDGEEAAPAPIDLGPDPASIAPADAPVYGELVVRPGGERSEELTAALSKLLDTDDPGGLIVDALDDELSEDAGFTYSESIEPWLGPRVGGFVERVDGDLRTGDGFELSGAVAISVTDREQAIESLSEIGDDEPDGEVEEKRYGGVDYIVGPDRIAFGFVEDFMVIGTESALRSSVDAAAGDPLAEADAYRERLDEVEEAPLATFFIDGERALEVLEENGTFSARELRRALSGYGGIGSGTVIATGTATGDTLELSYVGPPPQSTTGTPATELIAELPEDAWLAFGFGGASEALEAAVAEADRELGGLPGAPAGGLGAVLRREIGLDLEEDLLRWLGDVAFYIEGSSPLTVGAGLIIESTDSRASQRALEKLEGALRKRFGLRTAPAEKADAGFSILIPGAPVGAAAVERDGRVVIAAGQTSPDDLLDPGPDTLGSSDRWTTFSAALGEGIEPAFLLDFPPLIELIRSSGAADPDFDAAERYLRSLDYLVLGAASDSRSSRAGIVLGLREGGSSEPDEDESAAIVTAP